LPAHFIEHPAMSDHLIFKTRLVTSQDDWQIFETLLRTYAAKDLDQPQLSSIWKDLEDLPARYGHPEGSAVLLSFKANPDANALLIGCGALARTQMHDACEIKRLFILSDYRGKGGSKVLIQDLLQRAQAQGYDQAVLSTWKSNHTGLALYQSLGFQTVPSFKTHPNSELIFLGRSFTAADAQKNS
jgi:ribosomal protein S18 acetylase RimI-like enzyme